MDNNWKTISSKEIFSHPRLTLIEDEVELPSGDKTAYIKYKLEWNAATVIARRDDGKILVQKELSYPTGKFLLQFPGGAVPLGEPMEIGANRELMEEGKMKAGKLELLGTYYVNNRRTDAKMFVYLATDLREESLPCDPEEFLESFWFSEEEIDMMIKEGKIENSHLLASWLLYKAKTN